MKIRETSFLLVILMPLLSCSQDCFEIIEIKEINYDMSNAELDSQTSQEYIISENILNSEDDNLYHIYNEKFSLSQNYFGVEITERKSNRRFVKRRTDHFVEQMKHEDNPHLGTPVSTGNMKTIGSFKCSEYIIEQKYRSNLTYWIAEDNPFVYLYQHPYQFPGFVVSRQGNSGEHGIVETIFDLKKVECSEYFKNMVKELNTNE